jgi:dipeptidase E
MGKLYFYSDQIIDGNKRLDLDLINSFGGKQIKLGYIPSCGDKERKYYCKQKDYYSQYNIKDFLFYDVDDEYDEALTNELLSCDIIHISGGDPIYCLTNMHKRNFYAVLRQYFNNNGTIVGVSGGAVQLGKNAGLFKVFQSNIDDAIYTLDNLKALGIADFEFLPHYNRWNDSFKNAVKEYSRRVNTTICACNDGDGIILNNGFETFIGAIRKIENGIETTVL